MIETRIEKKVIVAGDAADIDHDKVGELLVNDAIDYRSSRCLF